MTGSDEALVGRIRSDVALRRPVDGREARSRARFLVALGRLARPLDREADPTHVTGSALVVGDRGVLLHLHKRLGLWLQPGGHLEPGETPWEAALREATEETGITLKLAEGDRLAHLDVHDGGRGHVHLDLRYVVEPAAAGDDTPAPPEGESQDVRWFSWEEAARLADPGLAGWLRHAKSRRADSPDSVA